ncbi:MAG: hypothetical protein AB1814_09070 [Thermodesulfobacteriota bacterium]
MLSLGAATVNYLNRYSLKEPLDHVAACGFRYIELMSTMPHMFPRHLSAAQRQDLRRALASRGLSLTSPQPAYRAQLLPRLRARCGRRLCPVSGR